MTEKLIKFYNDLIASIKRDILIGCIARIESHDSKAMRADVRPLLKYTAKGAVSSTDFSIIPDIPVLHLFAGGYYIRPQYARGDLVWVTFSTHEIELSLQGKCDEIDNETFARENAAVVYGLTLTGWNPPGHYSKDGLLIGHVDGGMTLSLGPDSIEAEASSIKFKGALDIDGDIVATGNVTSQKEVTAKGLTPATAVNLSTHLHPSSMGPTSSPTPGT